MHPLFTSAPRENAGLILKEQIYPSTPKQQNISIFSCWLPQGAETRPVSPQNTSPTKLLLSPHALLLPPSLSPHSHHASWGDVTFYKLALLNDQHFFLKNNNSCTEFFRGIKIDSVLRRHTQRLNNFSTLCRVFRFVTFRSGFSSCNL